MSEVHGNGKKHAIQIWQYKYGTQGEVVHRHTTIRKVMTNTVTAPNACGLATTPLRNLTYDFIEYAGEKFSVRWDAQASMFRLDLASEQMLEPYDRAAVIEERLRELLALYTERSPEGEFFLRNPLTLLRNPLTTTHDDIREAWLLASNALAMPKEESQS